MLYCPDEQLLKEAQHLNSKARPFACRSLAGVPLSLYLRGSTQLIFVVVGRSVPVVTTRRAFFFSNSESNFFLVGLSDRKPVLLGTTDTLISRHEIEGDVSRNLAENYHYPAIDFTLTFSFF